MLDKVDFPLTNTQISNISLSITQTVRFCEKSSVIDFHIGRQTKIER